MAEQVKPQDLPASAQEQGAQPEDAGNVVTPDKQEVAIHRQRIGFLGWKPDIPDFRDYRMAAPHPTAVAALPAKAFLPQADKLLPPIRDQGDQGSCTGHATRTAVQYKRALEKKAALELSPRFVYYNARVIEGTVSQDAGAQIRDVLKGVAKLGCASEQLCPYSDRVLTQRPSSAAYKEALDDLVLKYERVKQTQEYIKHCIVSGNPMIIGMTVFESFLDDVTAADGMLRMPHENEGTDGGHAVCIIGYDDGLGIAGEEGGVIVANSWGSEWGMKGPTGTRGYFAMPWAYLLDPGLCDDLWAIDVVKP
jgi:C1A family cysteine protease